jgi:hypothetical protein
VVCGGVSGVIVLDFDGPDGMETMKRLGLKPDVLTPNGGAHVYLRHPGWRVPTLNAKAKKKLGQLWPGLDIRADGGYAIFFGRNQAGRYRWLCAPVPHSLDVLPFELREFLGLAHPPKQAAAQTEAAPEMAAGATAELAESLVQKALNLARMEGRNNAGFLLACELRDAGFGETDAASVMRIYLARVPPTDQHGRAEPYTEREALESLRQAYSRPPREPRGKVKKDIVPPTALRAGDEESSPSKETAPELIGQWASEITPQKVQWVWPGFIPQGKLTIFKGDPSEGKSLVCLDLAARLSQGAVMPDRSTSPAASTGAVILGAEDDLADTVVPRLQAAGARLDRIRLVPGVVRREKGLFLLAVDEHIQEIEAEVEIANSRLLVVDPLVCFLSGQVDTHSDHDVRRSLLLLWDLAIRRSLAVIAVLHLNKNAALRGLLRAMGSVAFVAAARAVFAFGPDPSQAGRHIMAPEKLNLGPPPPALTYEITSNRKGDPYIKWGEATTISADQLELSTPQEQGRLVEARRFLENLLKDGPQPAREIYKEAEAVHIAERTVDRAKESLGIISFPKDGVPVKGRWQWRLPEKAKGGR